MRISRCSGPVFGRDQRRVGTAARRAGEARNRKAGKMPRRGGLYADGHDRRHAMRGADAAVERDLALGIARRRDAMVMSHGIPSGRVVQGMRAGGIRSGAMRMTGEVKPRRPQARIRIEPQAHHGDQHDCNVPAPANTQPPASLRQPFPTNSMNR